MKRVLLIQGRDFGDAIISTQLINTIGFNNENLIIDIFTKPIFKSIYKQNPYINKIICANFPLGKNRNINCKSIYKFIKTIYKLRSEKFDYVINTIGDIRENLIGSIITPKNNISVRWDKSHPFRNYIKDGRGIFLDKSILIKKNNINVYNIINEICKNLGYNRIRSAKVFNKLISFNKDSNIIAIHPFTKKIINRLSFNKWRILIEYLRKNHNVWIFCSPSEKQYAENEFKNLLNNKVLIKSDDLANFLINLSHTKLLIGLDSFAVHAAYAVGTNSIMINGANNYKIWRPPNSVVISNGKYCPYYPCYNNPKCIGENYEYICMKSVSIEIIINTIKKILI